jgi:hypothetical protein
MLNALGPASPRMYALTLPILDYALWVGSPEAVNLLEDGLCLWLVMLRNAPPDASEPLRLWPHWARVMATGIEHVAICMQIAASAVLLGGAQFLQVRVAPLVLGRRPAGSRCRSCPSVSLADQLQLPHTPQQRRCAGARRLAL